MATQAATREVERINALIREYNQRLPPALVSSQVTKRPCLARDLVFAALERASARRLCVLSTRTQRARAALGLFCVMQMSLLSVERERAASR